MGSAGRSAGLDARTSRAGRASPRRLDEQEEAGIVRAVTEGGMTRVRAAAVSGRSPSTVNNVLRKRRVAAVSGMDLVLAAEAAAIIGEILPREMSVLARAGLVRSVRSTERGHRLYVKADVKAVARRKTALTARTPS
jgi:hypothetical protein